MFVTLAHKAYVTPIRLRDYHCFITSSSSCSSTSHPLKSVLSDQKLSPTNKAFALPTVFHLLLNLIPFLKLLFIQSGVKQCLLSCKLEKTGYLVCCFFTIWEECSGMQVGV